MEPGLEQFRLTAQYDILRGDVRGRSAFDMTGLRTLCSYAWAIKDTVVIRFIVRVASVKQHLIPQEVMDGGVYKA